jgi:hypothetical protein
MHRVLGALVAGQNRNHRSDTRSDATVQLLESACHLFDSTSPGAISSTSVYAAASLQEAQCLAEAAHQLATEHRLLALVEFGDGRLRVKFLSVQRDPGGVDGE